MQITVKLAAERQHELHESLEDWEFDGKMTRKISDVEIRMNIVSSQMPAVLDILSGISGDSRPFRHIPEQFMKKDITIAISNMNDKEKKEMAEINMENLVETKIDVFAKFNKQLAVVTAGDMDNFNSMTIGWGMMGNIWGHPGSALTIYISPDRYTYKFLEENDYFTVSFFPESHKKDVIILGRTSGRDGNKIEQTSLTPKALSHGVGFEEAELTFVCKKIYSHQFELEKTPEHMAKIYESLTPHVEYIGYIEDVNGIVE